MVNQKNNAFAQFEESKMNSKEQHSILGGMETAEKGNGTPITQTSTKPSKTPLSTTTNGDPKPTDPFDIGLITP
ncbi:MAG: hypothetical protein HWE22_20490 [Flavobacteriales bacterium]|nr:hypothetical protein [Flavobacteriales bacterium]PIE86824.1 MAG: hypothetical protein CSA03_03545 [Bacteroidota bacterium]